MPTEVAEQHRAAHRGIGNPVGADRERLLAGALFDEAIGGPALKRRAGGVERFWPRTTGMMCGQRASERVRPAERRVDCNLRWSSGIAPALLIACHPQPLD